MRKLLILLLMFTVTAFGQKTQKFDPNKIEPNVLSNFATFHFDGTYSVFEAPVGFGIIYNSLPAAPGIYLAPVFNSDGVRLFFPIFHIEWFESFGTGLGYYGWEEGVGLRKFSFKDNFFISVGIELIPDKR